MGKKIFIAVPAYDEKIAVLGMYSIFSAIKLLEAAGHQVTLNAQLGCCYLDQARNHIVKSFLATDCTHLLFVDSDIAFDGDSALKLLNHDVQVIGGAYPYRSEDKEGFPVDICLNKDGIPIGDREKGILECLHVPTGLMLIRRDVFDILTKKFPDNVETTGELFHFRTGLLFIDEGDRNYYGEDVYFCRICNRAGIRVYCEPRINFSHIGTLHKKGNFDTYLRTEAGKRK